jgi:Flp pilus assembly pilin Flp
MTLKHRSGASGQTMSEYALILGGVAVLLIAALVLFGANISTSLSRTFQPMQVVSSSSPLGSTFSEISNSMIRLITDYYRKNNGWPRSWGEFAFTDLGLKSEDWSKAYDGIIYKPVGNRVAITPASGYTFVVNDVNGTKITLPSSNNWSLVYNMQTGTWHHKDFSGTTLQISTLQVIPPQPK